MISPSSIRIIYLIGLISVLHLVISPIVMGVCFWAYMAPDSDPYGPFERAMAEVLGWIFFFPGVIMRDRLGFDPESEILRFFINTLCWSIIVSPLVIVFLRYIWSPKLLIKEKRVMSSSVKKVLLIGVIHLLCSYMAIAVIMELSHLYHNEVFPQLIAVGLRWFFFFPSIIIGLVHVDEMAVGYATYPINTLLWCLVVIPIAKVLWATVAKMKSRSRAL